MKNSFLTLIAVFGFTVFASAQTEKNDANQQNTQQRQERNRQSQTDMERNSKVTPDIKEQTDQPDAVTAKPAIVKDKQKAKRKNLDDKTKNKLPE